MAPVLYTVAENWLHYVGAMLWQSSLVMLAVLKASAGSSFPALGLVGIAERGSALRTRLAHSLDDRRRISTRISIAGAAALLAIGAVLLPMARGAQQESDGYQKTQNQAFAQSPGVPPVQHMADLAGSTGLSANAISATSSLLPLEVTVVNEKGVPVQGARVKPYGLIYGSSASGWPRSLAKPREEMTDAKGKAIIQYPEYLYEKQKTEKVELWVEHPDYALPQGNSRPPALLSVSVDGASPPVVLRRGVRIVVSGYIGNKSNVVSEVYPFLGLSTFIPTNAWHETGRGIKTCDRMPPGSHYMMLFQVSEKGPTRFSAPVEFVAEAGKTNEFCLEMKPGRSVKGMLDESLARPIKNGQVFVRVYPIEAPVMDPQMYVQTTGESADYRAKAVRNWAAHLFVLSDWTDIRPDGSFEFTSLPRGRIELVALCDGAISRSPPDERGSDTGIGRPQVFTSHDEAEKITLVMEPTAAFEAKVVNEEGQPIQNAMVYFNVNVQWSKSSSGLFGDKIRIPDVLSAGRPNPPLYDGIQRLRPDFRAMTDTNGIVVMTNLPPWVNFCQIAHENYELPERIVNGGSRRRDIPVALTGGGLVKMTIQVQKKQKETANNLVNPKVSTNISDSVIQNLTRIRIEFRLAEREPASGLTEAVVEKSGQKVWMHSKVELSDADITSAKAVKEGKQPTVELLLSTAGAEKLAKLTRESIGKLMAILVDGKVVSTPLIHAKITGHTMIMEIFTQDEANRIVQGLSNTVTPPPATKTPYPTAPSAPKKDVSTGQDEANQPVGKEGLTITGHVIGPDGKPVPAASVMQGISRWTPHSNTKTDKEGCFTLPKCATGELILTVEASGLAPDIRSIIVAPEIGPLEIKLGPGHTLRGRVVDPSGKPMAGVYVSADTWRKCRTLRWNTTTDSEGQFRWDGAPEDEVFYDMGKRNYMSVRNLSLAPSDKEHVVTMRLPLRITGRVTDAQTGQPIEAFVVVPGLAFSNTNTGALPEAWSRWETAHGGTGVYEIVFTEPARERGHLIRVEADGYVPGVSVPFGDDQQQPIDFLLTRGRIASGIVRLPDGRPASDATVLLGTRTEVAYVRNGRNLLQNERRAVKTGTDGRFAFPAEAAPFTLVVLHEQGCAKILDTELAALPEIVLQPWGRIEGTLRVGNKPGAGEKLAVWPDSNTPQVVQEYTTMAGQDGRFVFEKVPPGKSKVGRVIRTRWTENNWWEGPGHQVAVTVPPGQTVTIQVGGTGRAVVGRIVAPVGSTNGVNWPRVSYSGSIGLPQPAYPKDFDSMSPKEKRAWLDAWQTSAEGKAFIEAQRGRQILYVITVNADGSFRADDMPSGDYVLRVEAELTSKDNPGGQRTCVGKLRHPFTIPDIPGGRSDEPLDLGTLEVAGTWN